MIFGRILQLMGVLVILYGLAKLVFGVIGLFSGELEMSQQLGQLFAVGLVNAVIILVGAAIFQHGGDKISFSSR